MIRVLKWLFPPVFFENHAYFRAIVLAGLYIALLLSQLYTFEKFVDVTFGYGLPGGMVTAWALAVALPLLEALSVPYLISMKLGGGLRAISKWCVLLMPSAWFVLLLWLNLSEGASKLNSGLFGATFLTPVGSWLLVFAGLMLWSAVLVVRELPKRPKVS